MDKDIADMAAAIEQAFAADPICGGRFCSGTAEAAARAVYAVVQARVERLTDALSRAASIVRIERDALVDSHTSPPEHDLAMIDPNVREDVEEMDAVLALVDALNPTGDNHESELVERQFARLEQVEEALANGAHFADEPRCHPLYPQAVAARQILRDRITALEAENARYRDALGYIILQTGKDADGLIDWQRCVDRIQNVAREALQHNGDEG